MKLFGVTVVPKKKWPSPVFVSPSHSGRDVTCRVTMPLRTTQRYVYADIVDDIKRTIQRARKRSEEGLPALMTKKVSLILLDGFLWVFDGHHTLAAHRALELPAPCFVYDRARGHGDEIAAPKLFTRR